MKRIYSLLAALTFFAITPQGAFADTYESSAGMSYIIFKVKHFGVTNAYGRFNDFKGNFSTKSGKFDFEVSAESIDTGIEKRDAHLRGPDFFNAKEFPKITFKSDSAKKLEGEGEVYELVGDLTLLGVTKKVTATFNYHGTGKHPMNGKDIAGGEAIFTIDRTDFGMEYGAPDSIGKDVTLNVSLMGEKSE